MSVWPQVEESFQAFMASGGSGFHYRCAYCRTDYTTEPALFDHVENFHRVPVPIYRADHPEYRVHETPRKCKMCARDYDNLPAHLRRHHPRVRPHVYFLRHVYEDCGGGDDDHDLGGLAQEIPAEYLPPSDRIIILSEESGGVDSRAPVAAADTTAGIQVCQDKDEEVQLLSEPPVTNPVPSTAERYGCTLCSFTTTNRDRMTKHLWIHSNKKTFVCAVCGLALTSKFNLRRHQQKVHESPRKAVKAITSNSQDGNMAQEEPMQEAL